MDETPTPQSQSPEQVQPSTTLVNPSPATQAPAPKKILTPEEKKAQRQATFKRLGLLLGLAYVATLLGISAWAFFTNGKELSVFDLLPIDLTQSAFNGFLMNVFHVLMGVTVAILFLYALLGLLKSMLTKKEDLEKKKKASRMSLFGGLAFLFFAAAWLVGIITIGPILTPSGAFTPIQTTPSNTIGLTSPIEISFDASGVPENSKSYTILSYTWDFGDGSTSTGMTTSHTYMHKAEGDGVYTVVLTVRYAYVGGEQTEQQFKTTVVIANEKTAAYFTASPESGELPLEVHFDATGSYDPDGEIVAYEWDLDGDGAFDDAEGEQIDHTFTQEGDFDVSIRVTDNSGEYSISTMTIEAGSIGGLRAKITTNVSEGDPYYVGEEYKFDGTLSQINDGKITKYTWDFGDGTDPVKNTSVNHSFEEKGTYTVTLTVLDQDGNSDVSTLEISVLEEGTAPSAEITTTPALVGGTVSGPVPFEVSFDANDSFDEEDDIIEYEWDFDNDGTVDDTGDTAVYTYQEEGNFEARLIVTDSVGNSDEVTVPVEVTEQGLIARLEINQSNGEVPLTVQFDSSSSSYKEGSIVSYEYSFGDGSETYIGGSNVTYKYTDVGTFTATMTVVASDGKRDSTSVQIVVRPVALTACFTLNTDSGKAPLFVSVDPSCSEGTIDTYQWDFGDGEISFDRKPETHTYSVVGTYTITLEVTSAEGIVSIFENEVTVR